MNSRSLSAIIAFVLLVVCLEYKFSLVPNSYNWKNKLLLEKRTNIECLILGSSHSYFGINPDEFSLKAFNLANGSQSLILDTELIKHFLDRLPQLQVIIIPLSYFSMEYTLLDSPENWRDSYSFHFFGVSEASWKQILTTPSYLSLMYLYSPTKMQEILKHHFNISYARDISPSGWYCGKESHPITQESAAVRVKLNTQYMKEKNIKKNLASLESILSMCNLRHLKVVFVTIPVHRYYFQNMDIDRWRQSQKITYALCKKYRCIYLDHLQNNDFDEKDFRDTDHLSINGASHFSNLLNKQVMSYLNSTYLKEQSASQLSSIKQKFN
jgi:hypothetical protein